MLEEFLEEQRLKQDAGRGEGAVSQLLDRKLNR